MNTQKILFFFIFISLLLNVISFFISKVTISVILLSTLFLIFVLFYRYSKHFSRYEKIYTTLIQLTRFRDIHSIIEFAGKAISQLIGAERTTIFLLNKEAKILWTIYAESLEIKEISIPLGFGIAGYVAKTGETINIKDDAYKDNRFYPIIDQKTGFRTKTLLCTPIYDTTDHIVGVIEVLNKKGSKSFNKSDEEILKAICVEIGSIILNARLLADIENLFESLLKSFATAVEVKDPVTKGHSLRVRKYAVNIAKALNLPALDLKILEYAAILHDVGKIGIPDNILSKPGKFTPEEYDIMKTHAEISKEILSKIHFPEEYNKVIEIASSHHEFLNGSGYPHKLKGDQISLLSRILCVVDIYDALVSYDRPYKRACSHEEAIRILYEMADEGKIDKGIVDIFVSKRLYQIEQRKFVRINKEITFLWRKLSFDDVKSVLPFVSKTQNISAGGIKFSADEELRENSFLEIELHLPNYTIETIAKVVYCIKNKENQFYEIGISFINLPKEAEEKLNNFLLTPATNTIQV
ncbi:MAG: HD domain-containing protein [Endomicrobia bacterium]|nr:HD domain-containing protein [Endomicrobiia bacterium]